MDDGDRPWEMAVLNCYSETLCYNGLRCTKKSKIRSETPELSLIFNFYGGVWWDGMQIHAHVR